MMNAVELVYQIIKLCVYFSSVIAALIVKVEMVCLL